MPLFVVTAKRRLVINAPTFIDPGRFVEIPSSNFNNPLRFGGQEVIKAFERKYGIDIRGVAMSDLFFDVKRLG